MLEDVVVLVLDFVDLLLLVSVALIVLLLVVVVSFFVVSLFSLFVLLTFVVLFCSSSFVLASWEALDVTSTFLVDKYCVATYPVWFPYTTFDHVLSTFSNTVTLLFWSNWVNTFDDVSAFSLKFNVVVDTYIVALWDVFSFLVSSFLVSSFLSSCFVLSTLMLLSNLLFNTHPSFSSFCMWHQFPTISVTVTLLFWAIESVLLANTIGITLTSVAIAISTSEFSANSTVATVFWVSFSVVTVFVVSSFTSVAVFSSFLSVFSCCLSSTFVVSFFSVDLVVFSPSTFNRSFLT